MKRLYFVFFAVLLITFGSKAQNIPRGIKYQAVARNLSGEVLANERSSLRIDLISGSSAAKAGIVYYSEIHEVTSDRLGLFNLVIGEGKSQGGSFDKVPWSSEDIWMQVAIKRSGEAAYSIISNSRLLAVPYAFHAGTANELVAGRSKSTSLGSGRESGVPSQSWSLFGNSTVGPLDWLGATNYADLVMITDNTDRLRILANGNVNLARSLKIGADLTVDSNAYLNKVKGSTFNYGPFTVDKTSPTYLTGTLTVDGKTDLNSSLNVNNGSSTHLTGDLTVDKSTDLKSSLNVDGITNLNSTLNVTNSSVTNLSGALNVGGVSKLNGQLTVTATLPASESDINNYPLIVQGSRNGVSIKIQGAVPNRNENFITFWNGNGEARGRIEGFAGTFEPDRSAFIQLVNDKNGQDSNSTQSQDPNQPLPDAPTALQNINNNYAFGALNATLNLVQNIVKFVINLVACIAGVGVFGDCDDVAWSGIDMAISAVQFAGYIAYNQGNPGVAYESGGADYAEWLAKFKKEEVLTFGDVVGVKAGIISKEFSDAENFMVVSRNPGVIGGMPEVGKDAVYEKVAFMGQVPVKVVGRVHKEDYILPSGNGDGMAIAVSAGKMKAMDFKRVIGVAWSESDSLKDFNYINTAVGINTNDLAATVENMQTVINAMQIAIKKLDPKYQPSFYDVSPNSKNYASGYSTAPSLKDRISSNVKMGQFENSTQALKEIKKYVEMQGLDLKQLPYLDHLMENPTLDEAQKALTHYNQVLTKLEGMMAVANMNRSGIQKN
jgi:soluble cytochrome b562